VYQEVRIKKKMVKEKKGIKESIYIDTKIVTHSFQIHLRATLSSIRRENEA